VLSPEEVKRVLTMATSLKARAMLTLAYGCGLRAGEVVRLRAGDIDSEQMIIRIVQSKGRKDRHVMLPAEVLELLRQWWKARPNASNNGVAPEHHWLFPGRSQHQPMTTRQFGRLFKEAAKAAALRKTVSLHSLRHSFATHLLERGEDIRVIQALLGHSKPETTARYSRVALAGFRVEAPEPRNAEVLEGLYDFITIVLCPCFGGLGLATEGVTLGLFGRAKALLRCVSWTTREVRAADGPYPGLADLAARRQRSPCLH
jgi:integrase